MKRLSVRRKGPGLFMVGPQGKGPTVTVRARDRRDALAQGKTKLREEGKLEEAVAQTYRQFAGGKLPGQGVDTRSGERVPRGGRRS